LEAIKRGIHTNIKSQDTHRMASSSTRESFDVAPPPYEAPGQSKKGPAQQRDGVYEPLLGSQYHQPGELTTLFVIHSAHADYACIFCHHPPYAADIIII
jgi:hypothetical protein